ncbi:rhodanese domain-containing protein CG4456-like [Calliphora vicina]|uniref:rhodanese domain-containing protein CG4456-like n=1 Tax=Calliphora vicina TaxID=7373 RepID=UPI00325BCD24
MAAKVLLNQLTKIARFNGFTATKFLSKRTCLPTATKSDNCASFVKQYCSVINNIPIVSYEEVKQLKKHPEILLIDVREPNELLETGEIPTSINIPLGQVAEELSENVDKGAFKAKYGRDKPDKNTEIIFHCKIGKRSQNAAELARSLGYKNTKNYLGSWTEWAEKEGLAK